MRSGNAILAIAAHPDDETAGLGGWLAVQATRAPIFVCFLTDGAPRRRRYWPAGLPGTRAQYCALRRREARAACAKLAPGARLGFARFPDQLLHRHLPAAAVWLYRLAVRLRPCLVCVPAFEAGHPDHDAANFLAARIWPRARLLEYSLYAERGRQVQFLAPRGPGWLRWRLPAPARRAKHRALACYRSQALTLAPFDQPYEFLRPLPCHDYSCPPGLPVWRIWGWPIEATEPYRAFASCHDPCAFLTSPTR